MMTHFFSRQQNGLLRSWREETCWLAPLILLIAQTIRKIEVEKVNAMLVVPFWPAQAWFQRVETLASC